jgi:hypothetical protein
MRRANLGCMCKSRRTPDAYTVAVVKLTSSSCRSVTYTQAMPWASDYGVSKHVAGAMVHEPVPYSTPSHPSQTQAASEASRGWQAAAYDECYAKPRLDPPAPVPLPSCYPLLYPAATPPEPPLPMSPCHCFVYFQRLLYRIMEPERNLGTAMASRWARGHQIVIHRSMRDHFMLCEHRDLGWLTCSELADV